MPPVQKPQPVPTETADVTVPLSQIDRAPAPVVVSQDPGLEPTGTVPVPVLPVSEQPVSTSNVEAQTNIVVSQPSYLAVDDEGSLVLARTTVLNFTGDGVTVTASGSTAQINITAGAASYGNANVTGLLSSLGSNTISTTGNITGNYFIGNGSQLTGIAASYGDSNVTTLLGNLGNNPVSTTGNIIGGNITSIDGAITSNSTITIDNRASGNAADVQLYAADDILLQARDRTTGSTTEGGDINIYAGDSAEDGDSSGGDIQIFAGDGGAANIDFGGSGGFITIRSGQGGSAIGDGVSSAESGGSLTLEAGDAGGNNGNIDRGAAGGDVFITAGDSTGNLDAGGDIVLTTGTGGSNALAGNVQITIPSSDLGSGGTWTFGATGNLTLPRGGIVYETNIPFGGLSGNTIALAPSGGTHADQQLLVYPTAGADANHLHLTSGNLYNTELFVGDDNLYVKLANTGNIVINSNDGTGNSAQWTFGTDGYLNFPRDTSNISTDPYLRILGGPSPQILSEDASLSGPANLAIVTDYLTLSGSTGNRIILQADAGAIATDAAMVLSTNLADLGNVYSWTFGTDGNLTAPGNIVGITANNTGHLRWVGNSSGDGSGYTTLQLVPDDTTESGDQYLIIDPTGGGHIHIRAGGTQDNSNAILYLGGENSYVSIGDGNNPPVTIAANNHSWSFGVDSQLSAAGNIYTLGEVRSGSTVTPPLPLANLTAVAGSRAFVSDANLVAAGNFGQQISGGAGNTVPVWSDGTNWYIG